MTRNAAIALGVCGVVLNAWAACALFVPGAWMGRNDFLSLYAGGRLAGTPALYDRTAVRDVQLRAAGEAGDSLRFSRLPYYGLLLKPVAALPYRAAYAVWEAISAAAFVGFALLWPGGRAKWLVCCWALPAFVALVNGQDVSPLLVCVAAALLLSRRGQEWAAGIVLALCASKFHLVIFVPVVVLAQRRWRMLGGAAAACALMAAASFAAQGPDWPAQYLGLLKDPRVHPSLAHMPGLRAFYGGMAGELYLHAAMMLGLAAVVWVAARREKAFEAPLCLALVAGVLAAYHAYLADCVMLLPAVIYAIESGASKYGRYAALTLATPLPWFLLQMPAPLAAITRLLIAVLAVGLLLDQRGRTSNSTGRAVAFTEGS